MDKTWVDGYRGIESGLMAMYQKERRKIRVKRVNTQSFMCRSAAPSAIRKMSGVINQYRNFVIINAVTVAITLKALKWRDNGFYQYLVSTYLQNLGFSVYLF